MAIPYREFDGEPGDYSVDTAGPVYLQKDLDKLFRMFNPEAVHEDGSPGGIDLTNFANSVVYSAFIEGVQTWIDNHPDFIVGKIDLIDDGSGNVTIMFVHDEIGD